MYALKDNIRILGKTFWWFPIGSSHRAGCSATTWYKNAYKGHKILNNSKKSQ